MTKSKQSIDQAYQELQRIVAEFEADEVDLEKSLPKFKRGLELAAELKKKLSVLQNEVEEIKASFQETAPVQEEQGTEEESANPDDIPF